MKRAVSGEITIAADPATIFDVLADPSQHTLFDGSGSVKGRVNGPPRLYLGANFAMRMRIAAPYVVRNRVIEYDEDRLIAWRHFARHVWRWELTPTEDGAGTQVSETFDYDPSPAGRFYERLGWPTRNQAAINASLQQLKTLIESRVRTA